LIAQGNRAPVRDRRNSGFSDLLQRHLKVQRRCEAAARLREKTFAILGIQSPGACVLFE
jgi:hypothetical protein